MRMIRTSTQERPQSTAHILMIRPASFGFNPQTAETNAFQQDKPNPAEALNHDTPDSEFSNMVHQLSRAGVAVTVFDDTPEPRKPDAIFPNNWISFHQSGKVVLYPMMAENRRWERRTDLLDALKETFYVEEIIDLSYFEKEGKFLEGTGSMVLDRSYKIAYACLSPRTHPDVLAAFGKAMGYQIVTFNASDENNVPVYHTNVLMCVGDIFAVVCLEAVKNPDERHLLRSALEDTGKYIVEISQEQVRQFAGNMLLVKNQKDQQILAMSTTAYNGLSASQRDALDDYARLLPIDIPVIEVYGGGSVRCMMAEIHLPSR